MGRDGFTAQQASAQTEAIEKETERPDSILEIDEFSLPGLDLEGEELI